MGAKTIGENKGGTGGDIKAECVTTTGGRTDSDWRKIIVTILWRTIFLTPIIVSAITRTNLLQVRL